MSTEIESLKTNEFLRRRKLRLQQVREQSKDIAKKIRQRAKIEKLRQVADVDAKKEKEYLQSQEKLVKQLEILYSKSLSNVGASHKTATNLRHASPDKIDLSKQRGREATAELRKKKQKSLDEQKKLLDRKLQAREAANEISREKSTNVATKLLAKSSADVVSEEAKEKQPTDDTSNEVDDNTKKDAVKQSDMATQWDIDGISNEWEPNVPTLSLPKDDSAKDSLNNNNTESKSDKSKRLDLFALSEEMPSSLRGGLTNIPEERPSVKPSLTMISEYLQSRRLRLRDTDVKQADRKSTNDLNSLKQTILRTRPRTGVSGKTRTEKSPTSSAAPNTAAKKDSVTVYNHSTRDSRDMPRGDEKLVIHNPQTDEDAYSQAMKEATTIDTRDREHQRKLQEMRNKIAMTKLNVEKEYNDTMTFLNSLPKDKKSRPIKTAYMDERRQQMLKQSRQQKLQNEYRKLEKQCRKHSHMNSRTNESSELIQNKSNSPVRVGNDFETSDLQYSWMPVPESDGNLAIHTIPTTVKEAKSGNTVKFSKVDSYHEYRSRHKHTPPTKDVNDKDKHKKVVEAVIIQSDSELTDCSSTSSNTSSFENLDLQRNSRNVKGKELTDAERIIIYKVLNSKKKDKVKKNSKLISEIAKSLSSIKDSKQSDERNQNEGSKDAIKETNKDTNDTVAVERLEEGIYKTTKDQGDNITSLYFSDKSCEAEKVILTEDEVRYGRLCRCGKKNSKDQLQSKGTDVSCERGDRDHPDKITSNICTDCKCRCAGTSKMSRIPENKEPSAAESTSSFKTATTDKANVALPDGGYIKMIDDDGQEAGKFYIGASGFLRDDAYEVIIQLRKKDSTKEDNKMSDEKIAEQKLCLSQEIARQNQEQSAVPVQYEKGILTESEQQAERNPDAINKLVPENETREKVVDENGFQPCVAQNNIEKMNVSSVDNLNDLANKYSDKSVCTSFQLAYAIPDHVTKCDSAQSKPGVSIQTQTTLNSPNQRPVFIHMSSSTSTAYMSPPEIVLPKCLRHESDGTRETLQAFNFNNYCEKHEGCTCKRCMRKKNIIPDSYSIRNRCYETNSQTPPNTVRSQTTSDIPNEVREHKQKNRHYKCRRCRSRTEFKTCNKLHCHKSARNAPTYKRSSRHLVQGSSAASSYKNKISTLHTGKNEGKSQLNPIVKKYVNQLLSLNRQGIKAIEVVNQECSAVTTPGSSIIDVPRNAVSQTNNVDHKISLGQIKSALIHQILDEYIKNNSAEMKSVNTQHVLNPIIKHCKVSLSRIPKKRSLHKIKSLNISKHLSKNKSKEIKKLSVIKSKSSKDNIVPTSASARPGQPTSPTKVRSKSSPTPRQTNAFEINRDKSSTDVMWQKSLTKHKDKDCDLFTKFNDQNVLKTTDNSAQSNVYSVPSHRATSTSPETEIATSLFQKIKNKQMNSGIQSRDMPINNTSTQTSRVNDSDINYMKLAEDKLQNMEKIADLTEKCTQRLSNLAKVLEEVRKNKSLAYSQISTSDSASDTDQNSEKHAQVKKHNNNNNLECHDSFKKIQFNEDVSSTPLFTNTDRATESKKSDCFIPFLMDIPKPAELKLSIPPPSEPNETDSNLEDRNTKARAKPPPALSRINLRYGQGYSTPHELSTVVEVDSPLSLKVKNQSSRVDIQSDAPDRSERNAGENTEADVRCTLEKDANVHSTLEKDINPDLLKSNVAASRRQEKIAYNDSPAESKAQIMDLKQFNKIMLQPFISIQEYAKQCDIGTLDEGSNFDDIPKDDHINDDVSSMQSDSSLPDVIAELLKRKIISEPFKFDTASNIHSTTGSSESTLSVLALSKVRKDKKKSSVMFQDKENVAETSDTLSFSSNPDLEHAFKKLGMGWASSTLKKTKERLALSSSSNTSSSSLSQIKIKGLSHQNVPALVTDSVSSMANMSKKPLEGQRALDNSKNIGQQTSLTKSMTVKEFLTNELANKITFTSRSNRNDTEEEFVSLFETKMPEEMKHSSQIIREEQSVDSGHGGNNRARTSTPVQIYKSMTYHSSSSSNLSNGLFSNVDDLSSVKVTSNSLRNHSTSDKDDLTIPNCSLRIKKVASDASKSD